MEKADAYPDRRDELKTGEYLKKGLEESGFSVELARDGVDGLHLALEDDYDLVVLDVMMPRKDGWAMLKDLRARKSTPVLFLSARDDVEDRVRGLELGADDYLVKPVCVCRVAGPGSHTGAARSASRSGADGVGDLEIDSIRRRVKRAGVRIELTPARVLIVAIAGTPARRGTEPYPDRVICVGHEFRQRHQCRGGGRATVARQDRRRVSRQADP